MRFWPTFFLLGVVFFGGFAIVLEGDEAIVGAILALTCAVLNQTEASR